ncbi:hypothetical protein FJZ53_00130 [Candidatus Woesearchaeota archaeon]|nr:hypothetical protein [Candidatus Woesearchaeota archaeon]
MRCKKTVLATIIAASFAAGVLMSEPIKDLRKNFRYEAAEGFYERPYNLKIETRKNMKGEIETYLYDDETKQYHKIGQKMYVGDYKHRIKSVTSIPKELAEKHKLLKFILDAYSLVSDKD